MFPVNFITTFHFGTTDYISCLDDVFAEVLLQFNDIIGVSFTYELQTFENFGGIISRTKKILKPFLDNCRMAFPDTDFATQYSINPEYTGVEIDEDFSEGLICIVRVLTQTAIIMDIKIYLENSKHILQ